MADRGFGPRQGMPGRLEDLDIRLPGHRVHGQDRAPGRAHDDYTPRQDEGHAFGFVRHTRHYDDKDRDKDRYAAGSPGLPPRGGFRGLGPAGYSRSDQRIREDICDRLTDDDTIDARGISVRVVQGEVALEGHVGSRRMKEAASLCAADCAGVRDVRNGLNVRGE